jgi:uncharacterized protein (TIGR02284 family)
MSESNKQAIATLNRMIKLSKNSEEGFRVAAESVKNRGLKTLLRTYAQQRARFAADLQAEVTRLGGRPRRASGFLGMVHRGWIIIKAALTIGPHSTEEVVLAECQRGEAYALTRYSHALKKELPATVRELITHHYETVQKVAGQIQKMRGGQDGRLVIRLFNSDEDVQQALDELTGAGFVPDNIRTLSLEQAGEFYQNDVQRSTVLETASAGGLGGAVVGGVLGLIATIGAGFIPGLFSVMAGNVAGALAAIVLGSAIIGALFGAFMGILTGIGISGEDSHIYDDSITHGRILMMVQTENNRAVEASNIMRQINLARSR